MSLRATYFKRVFEFNFKARTSRGRMLDKTSWFIKISEAGSATFGIGEAGPLPGLSIDSLPDFEERLAKILDEFNASQYSQLTWDQVAGFVPREMPSIRFAFETALLDLNNGGKRILFDNEFVKGRRIPINGLIWMGDMDFMMGQISIKISEGFDCIKLKVGGLDFDRECDVLQYIRKRYFRENIVIRLDANGAFKVDDVLYKLEQLNRFGIHSIEQPIKPDNPHLEELCRKSPIPIALDEELIGKTEVTEMADLLDRVRPQYIVLKPMLHGGLKCCEEWIRQAEQRKIGWWMTSSLESSVGLNAIAQFTANYKTEIPQGLGTGKIYDNNFESPLEVSKGMLFHNPKEKWDPQITDPDVNFPLISEADI
ncbi:MAG TPA: o-succinylbenzoate synthase [Chryseosolibacter sp.]